MKTEKKCITDYVEIGTTIIYLICVCEDGSKIDCKRAGTCNSSHARRKLYVSRVVGYQLSKKKKKKVIERRVAEKFKKNIMHIVM